MTSTVDVGIDAAGRDVDFAKIGQDDAMRLLDASAEGLTSAEATRRLAEHGPNALPEESHSPVLAFLGHCWNPLAWAMEAAAIVAIALLDYPDFALILALLLCNATIAFVEEASADRAIKALASALAPRAKVLRDGALANVDAAGLVPGDVVLVRLGDIVPADVKILGEGDGETPLQIDQAALTGESMPVKKFAGGVAFAGSTVKQGERRCVVYATGAQTFFGRAAGLLSGAEQTPNLHKIMTKIGGACLLTIGIWCTIELGVQFGHYGHACKAGQGGCPTLLNMLVIIVGGIPIAMPVVLSVTLALGAYALAKEGAIVSRMSAVEEMAGMDVLCSDKTGTLTLNELTVDVANVRAFGEHSIADVLRFGALSASVDAEEPIDMVLHASYADSAALDAEFETVKFVPFNPTDKYTIAHRRERATGVVTRVLKGAPQVVVRLARDSALIEESATATIAEYAARGFRGLGVAISAVDGDDDWEMVGLLPLYDPPRHDTRETVERCHGLGIGVKMITGDQLLIGQETARQLGMGTDMFTTESLLEAKRGFGLVGGHASVEDLVENADGFAEVFPEHKFLIVKTLQERQHMVGMTGDGVNDAPALKKADVGIAVAGATDAARAAADIVLTHSGLSAIVSAIVGAREIFQRMTTYARYTVAMTFRICFTFGLLTVVHDWYFPTILIVLLAVFNDGAMIALSKDRVKASPAPNRWNLQSIFVAGAAYGLYLTASTWLFFALVGRSSFFESKLGMFSLDERGGTLDAWCRDALEDPARFGGMGLAPSTTLCAVPGYADQMSSSACSATTVLEQCISEQRYVRGAMTRAAVYAQVSISGQALVFVVRTAGHSLMSRAGGATYAAFFAAQLAASAIAALGLNGYEFPRDGLTDCQFCTLSTGGAVPFWSTKTAPLAGTEGEFTASVLGATSYVLVAWIWSALWYVGLDPIKWFMAYVMNEDGARKNLFFGTRGERVGAGINLGVNKRARGGPAATAALSRASIVRV